MAGVAQELGRDRARIDDRYKWNLAEIFPTDVTWREGKTRIAAELPALRAFAGRLGESPQTLADALDLSWRLDKEITRLYVYAGMRADEDTREARPQGMKQEMQQLHADFGAQAAFLEPEILRLGADAVTRMLAAEPRLEIYSFYLQDIVRRAAHTLTDSEERILADVRPLAGSPSNIFGIFSNADFAYPTVTLSTGETRRVDQAGYAELRARANRADREQAMSAFFGALGAFNRTFGTTMNAEVQKVRFLAKTRKYASNLELALDGPNVPVGVYMRLIEGVNEHLPSFHRYLRLRRRMLEISDDLHYFDLYAPLVSSVDLRYTADEAADHVVAASGPLGEEYMSVLRRAFDERWIDMYPTDGKLSGAYSNGGAYDVHPYILMNYLGQYNDVSTLAHELGHTMQSYYSNRMQPYPLADYPIFVAEVASTFNEALLNDYMLRRIPDTPTRLSLLGSYLENLKGNVFRQTQFAEFELRMHQMSERGEPITGEALSRLYLDITRRYYGHDAGICIVDDYIAQEWSYIPHFYKAFYVFQYATSFTAAEALASKVLAGDADTTARYLQFLGAGGSKYPIELLKEAGVDMTTDEPLRLTIARMNAVMDEVEELLKSR